MTDDEFRDLICENLACRLSDGEDCSKTMDHFLERCFYVPVRKLDSGNPSWRRAVAVAAQPQSASLSPLLYPSDYHTLSSASVAGCSVCTRHGAHFLVRKGDLPTEG